MKSLAKLKLKYAVQLRKERVEGLLDTKTYIGLEHIESSTGRLTVSTLDNGEMPDEMVSGGESLCNLFESGDILFGKLRPYLAKTWIANFSGRCTTELLVMKPLQADANYLKYNFLAHEFLESVTASSYGSKMPRADWDFIGNEKILNPPIEYQRLIVAYLDRETDHIDTLIAAKERLLVLMAEKRQALITRAVTRGLEENNTLKDSKVIWFGFVPEEWTISAIKYATKKVGSGVTPKGGSEVYKEEGILFLRSQNVHFSGLELDDVVYISEEVHESMSNSKVENGDVLLNVTGASIGRCFYYNGISGQANVNQHVCIVRPNEKITTKFLNYFLSSEAGQGQIEFFQTGGGREGLNFDNLKSFIILLPRLEKQIEIVEFLDRETFKMDAIDKATEHTIALLKERRSALITAAVTGQLIIPEA